MSKSKVGGEFSQFAIKLGFLSQITIFLIALSFFDNQQSVEWEFILKFLKPTWLYLLFDGVLRVAVFFFKEWVKPRLKTSR